MIKLAKRINFVEKSYLKPRKISFPLNGTFPIFSILSYLRYDFDLPHMGRGAWNPPHTLPQQESKIKHNKLIKYSILQDENIDSPGLQIKYMKKIGIFPPSLGWAGGIYIFWFGEGGGTKYAEMTITINWHVNHFLCDIYLPSFIDYKHYYVIQV